MTGLIAAVAAVRALDAAEAETRLAELSAILVDAVAHGASVNFLAAAPAMWLVRGGPGAGSCLQAGWALGRDYDVL